jgi:DNA polymerase-4
VSPFARQILHINTDDFFATLARQRDSSLRHRPVIVGNILSRGSVVSASYEARAAGVHPHMTMSQAARRAPDAALVQVDWAYAHRASRELFRVLEGYAPRIEHSGLDEAYVDYTGSESLLGVPLDAGRRLQQEVRLRLGLDVSIGVAANKLVSRFASTAAKRHRLLDVIPGREASFLAPQAVHLLPCVGPVLGRQLAQMGVATVGALAGFPVEVLEAAFGTQGRKLAEASHGIDHTPVALGRGRPLLCESWTFQPDALRWDVLEGQIDVLCSRLGQALRARSWAVRRFALELEHSDRVRVQRQAVLRHASNLDAHLFEAARRAFVAAYRRRVRVRRLELRVPHVESAPVQLDLFQVDAEARLRRLMHATDQVRRRFGDDPRTLLRARSLVGDDRAGSKAAGSNVKGTACAGLGGSSVF